MTRTIKKMTLVLAILGLMNLVLAQPASASVPFKGTGKGEIVGPNGLGGLAGTATGQATHLGRYTRTENVYLDGSGGATGDITFTAANGDRLTANFVGTFTSPSTLDGVYTITGGTGRFVNATGSADFFVKLDSSTSFTFEFKGSIDY